MEETSKNRCVVLASGGLDSTVTLAKAIADGFSVFALTLDYGQRHRIELEAANRICLHHGVEAHKLLKVDLRQFGGSSLTDDLEVPKETRGETDTGIPNTYVPGRNLIFLSLAVSWAESLGARDVFIGVSSVDYSGYPDCRTEFIRSFQNTANLGTRAADSGPRIEIHAPLLHLTKADTVKLGLNVGVDFSLTWTCYDPELDGTPCGTCESCRLREKGFSEAGVDDPTRKQHV